MKIYTIALIIIVILVVLPFYWFSLRPIEIRQGCFSVAQANAIEDTNPPLYQGSEDRIVRMQLQYQLIESEYLSCVQEKGYPN